MLPPVPAMSYSSSQQSSSQQSPPELGLDLGMGMGLGMDLDTLGLDMFPALDEWRPPPPPAHGPQPHELLFAADSGAGAGWAAASVAATSVEAIIWFP